MIDQSKHFLIGLKSGLAIGFVIGFIACLILIASVGKCHAQTGELGELPTTPPRYDTIPADLIYRTRYGQTGWVRGWEVRKVDSVYRQKNVGNLAIYMTEIVPIHTHIKYLQSDRRPFPKGTRVARIEGVKEY